MTTVVESVTPVRRKVTCAVIDVVRGTVTIDVLVEDSAHRPGIRAEHGLSLLVTTDRGRLLFDAGQSGLLLENADFLELPLEHVRYVVLSHGHYDHGGAVPNLARQTGGCTVFAHPRAFDRKFEKSPTGEHDIGLSWVAAPGIDVSTATAPRELPFGLLTTGEIPRHDPTDEHPVGSTEGRDGVRPDGHVDEQAVVIPTPSGAIVLVGCAHAGLTNTLAAVRTLVGDLPLRSVIGGFHLLHAADEELATTAASLATMDVKSWCPCHCSGRRAQVDLLRAMPGRVRCCATGDRLTFDEE